MSTVMELCSSAIRGVIVAPPNKKLVVADLANIEGRMLAWLAGEQWKLAAFREFDAGQGADLYKLAYAKAFGIPADLVDDHMRQIGKVMELALGYAGGVGAFLTFAAAYGIDLEAMAEAAIDGIPDTSRTGAEEFLQWQRGQGRSQYGLSDQAFIVCDSFKRMWRQAHPQTVSYWKVVEHDVRSAIEMPGETLDCRRHKIRRDGDWLRIRLPSGRYLCYPGPRVDEDGKISYMGVNQYSRKWERLHTHGGKLVENITQAAARDVLAYSMPPIEAAGYEIVATVHDEIIAEAIDFPQWDAAGLSRLMAATPEWAPDLPLAAKGFECYRYRKG